MTQIASKLCNARLATNRCMDPSALRAIAGQSGEASLRKLEGELGLDSVTVSYVTVRCKPRRTQAIRRRVASLAGAGGHVVRQGHGGIKSAPEHVEGEIHQ